MSPWCERVYACNRDEVGHMRVNVGEFIQQYYNRQRLHSALGYHLLKELEQ